MNIKLTKYEMVYHDQIWTWMVSSWPVKAIIRNIDKVWACMEFHIIHTILCLKQKKYIILNIYIF